jgi:hypothetical protein
VADYVFTMIRASKFYGPEGKAEPQEHTRPHAPHVGFSQAAISDCSTTDRIDAWVLAELVRRQLLPALWLSAPRLSFCTPRGPRASPPGTSRGPFATYPWFVKPCEAHLAL